MKTLTIFSLDDWTEIWLDDKNIYGNHHVDSNVIEKIMKELQVKVNFLDSKTFGIEDEEWAYIGFSGLRLTEFLETVKEYKEENDL